MKFVTEKDLIEAGIVLPFVLGNLEYEPQLIHCISCDVPVGPFDAKAVSFAFSNYLWDGATVCGCCAINLVSWGKA